MKVELIPPTTGSTPCSCFIQESGPSEYTISYIPLEPGHYKLRLLFNGELIQNKTFDTDVQSVQAAARSPTTPIVRVQKLHPTGTPELGNDICLKSNAL